MSSCAAGRVLQGPLQPRIPRAISDASKWMSSRRHPGGDYAYATELAPGLGAPYHQHMFSARLDMAVDEGPNAVEEIDVRQVPIGDGNQLGNAFTRSVTRFTSEKDAQRLAAPDRNRVWAVVNTEKFNRMGRPVSYVLIPEGKPTLRAADGSSIGARAEFATKHLWGTPYEPSELWPSGRMVAQHPGGSGLPEYTAADRPINGTNVVLWHTFGLAHFPRLEDWPIMPVDYAGFTLKPDGFFDRNPTIDVPMVGDHCAPSGDADHGHEHL